MGRNAEEDFPLNHKNSMLIHLTKAKKAHSKNSQFQKKSLKSSAQNWSRFWGQSFQFGIMCIYKMISYSYSPKLWVATSTWENILLALNQFSLLWMVTQALVSIWYNSCKHHYLSVILIYRIIIHIVFELEWHPQLRPRVLLNYKYRL